MGMFTWKTSDTDRTIKARWIDSDLGRPTTTQATLIMPDNARVSGWYDGYGLLNGYGIFALIGASMQGLSFDDIIRQYGHKSDTWRKHFFNHYDEGMKMIKLVEHDKGQLYGDVKTSESCETQGFMFADNGTEGLDENSYE